MKNKKILFLLIAVLIIILICLFFITKKFNSQTNETPEISEYTPEEEISSVQLRETVVTLYFLDSNNVDLKSEGKHIDSASLLQNPYKELVSLLLAGPQNENLKNVFPDNTQILDASLENHCAILNFSPELLNFTDENQKFNIINCLLNTLTGLNEVNSIKILVDNTPSDIFDQEYTITNL